MCKKEILKNYLYHFVPQGMIGNILFPLNKLKDVYPSLYREEVKKYQGREVLLQRKIPQLDCLWNDVIFLLAVHPSSVNETIGRYGLRTPKEWGWTSCFQIDLEMLDSSLLCTFIHLSDGTQTFSNFDKDRMTEYSIIPEAQHQYYREKAATNSKNFLFASRIWHVLYKGTIDVTNVPIITL